MEKKYFDKETKIMWTLCILNWVCCLASIIVRPYSIIAWWILFSLQMMCLLGIIIIFIICTIQFKKESKRLDAEYEQLCKEVIIKWEGYATTADDVKPSVTIKLSDKSDGETEVKDE